VGTGASAADEKPCENVNKVVDEIGELSIIRKTARCRRSA